MKLTLTVLGFQVAHLYLELDEHAVEHLVIDKPIKGISRLWVRSMTR